jgi:hypothetical protein
LDKNRLLLISGSVGGSAGGDVLFPSAVAEGGRSLPHGSRISRYLKPVIGDLKMGKAGITGKSGYRLETLFAAAGGGPGVVLSWRWRRPRSANMFIKSRLTVRATAFAALVLLLLRLLLPLVDLSGGISLEFIVN